MASLHPVELFSLAIPADGEPVPALIGDDEQATFRITMAAIDPTAPISTKEQTNGAPAFTGSVLKIIRVPMDDEESDEDEDEDSMDMADLLDQSSDADSDDEDVNGAPSDPAKSPKAKRMADLKKALAEAQADDEDEDMDVSDLSAKKGKGKAIQPDADSDSELDDSELEGAEQFVLCTLDPSKAYQQTLDITVSEYETVYFTATGTHKIYLTGNVLFPVGNPTDDYDSEDDSDDEDYGLPPGMTEDDLLDDDESDELDDVEDPRVTELEASGDEEEAPPKLIKTETGKGKNKRPLEDSSELEPAPIVDVKKEKTVQPAAVAAGAPVDETKLTKNEKKKLRKKQKDNQGNAVEVTTPTTATVNGTGATPDKADKKVKTEKKPVDAPQTNGHAAASTDANKSKVRVVQGVTIDDRKPGSGQGAKKGSKVSMRYIGKVEGKTAPFDSNKKGKPFQFTLGTGQVIKGWDIGMQGITVGAERRVTVPPHMGYGSKKQDGIPANSTLVFDVKCLAVE